jgi:hypothetical protein
MSVLACVTDADTGASGDLAFSKCAVFLQPDSRTAQVLAVQSAVDAKRDTKFSGA